MGYCLQQLRRAELINSAALLVLKKNVLTGITTNKLRRWIILPKLLEHGVVQNRTFATQLYYL